MRPIWRPLKLQTRNWDEWDKEHPYQDIGGFAKGDMTSKWEKARTTGTHLDEAKAASDTARSASTIARTDAGHFAAASAHANAKQLWNEVADEEARRDDRPAFEKAVGVANRHGAAAIAHEDAPNSKDDAVKATKAGMLAGEAKDAAFTTGDPLGLNVKGKDTAPQPPAATQVGGALGTRVVKAQLLSEDAHNATAAARSGNSQRLASQAHTKASSAWFDVSREAQKAGNSGLAQKAANVSARHYDAAEAHTDALRPAAGYPDPGLRARQASHEAVTAARKV